MYSYIGMLLISLKRVLRLLSVFYQKLTKATRKESLYGTNSLDRPAKSHYFGMTSGPMLHVLGPVY